MKKLHLNLHASCKHPIELCNDLSYEKEELSIKVEYVAKNQKVTLKTMSNSDYSVGDLNSHGVTFDAETYYTFELELEEKGSLIVKLFKDKECVGQTLLSEQLLTETDGSVKICLVDPNNSLQKIAHINFDYLFLPMGDACLTQPPQSFMYMGHRGCGKTFDRTAKVLENTIESFKEAQNLGATFVELDVQLTKDLVPVVFHDDFVAVFLQDKNGKEKISHIPVKDLTLDELKTLKVDFARDGSGSCYDERFSQLFPTLDELLNATVLDWCGQQLGLFVEVKYTEPDQGIVGLMNKKVIVDKLLDSYRDSRHQEVMFCSFDPEICLLLKHSQSAAPVFFITCGENAFTTSNPSEPYDIRTRTRRIAANFAIVHDLSGISINCDPLMNCKDEYKDLTKYLKDAGKLLYSWGSANCNSEFVELQRTIGMAGIITDKLPNFIS